MAKRARGVETPTPAEALADRLHSSAIKLLRRLRAEDVYSGLTGPRASALSVIVFAGPVTPGQLAAAEQVRPPTMTRLVRALERDGLVRREPDVVDRRVVRLHATPRGEALLVEGRRRRVRKLAATLSRLPVAEHDELARATDILARVVQELS